jgi:monoamine oxidase
MSTQADVIIVGAGAAGLSAAKGLSKQGISFIVVEASHRIGGCAYLVAGPDAKNRIDESNPFIDFAKNQGAIIEEYQYDSHYIYNGTPLDENEMKARYLETHR